MINKSDVSFLYNNHNSETIFDCFYAYMIDELDPADIPMNQTNYLTPYCRRSLSNDDINEIEGSIKSRYTFKNLSLQGITSEDLLQWSISIDIIEQYSIYLVKNDTKFDKFIFNNCSSLWFGSNCQYTFNLSISIESFGDYVNASFKARKQYEKKLLIHTCYPYLSGCYRGPEPMCLDWREICDGKIDCIEGDFGVDEKYCHELEVTECNNENEYRCHNGAQCIPLEFYRDGFTSRDCLDGTDEVPQFLGYINHPDPPGFNCIDKIIFACEETTCRYSGYFSCGDGECIYNYGTVFNIVGRDILSCVGTSRDIYYSRTIGMSAKQYPADCYKLLFCKLGFYNYIQNDLFTELDCLSSNWSSTINCTVEYLSFPPKPLVYGYFQPVYLTENLMDRFRDKIPPTYICNDRRLCSHLPKATSPMDGLDCRRFHVSGPFEVSLDYYLRADAEKCQLMGNIYNYTSISSLFYCNESYKHISKHRLIDGFRDCYHNEDENYKDSCLLNDTQRFNCTSEDKCLSPIGFDLRVPGCKDREDKIYKQEVSVFSVLCSQNRRGLQLEDNETYDTNCEWWPCNNPYTRCDLQFHCANGIDELNCSNTKCKINEYQCYDSLMVYYCIPQEYIYEIPLDCINNNISDLSRKIFYSNSSTININNEYISWKNKSCLTTDDICGSQSINDQKHFCALRQYSNTPTWSSFFSDLYDSTIMCNLISNNYISRQFFVFSTWNIGNLPSKVNSNQQPIDTKPSETLLIRNTNIELIEYCNRGILIFEGKLFKKKCLCPPNYFGDRCQWQNQRISLTLKIRTLRLYEKRTFIYDIFIYLIDDQNQIIHYYEKIDFISSRDCDIKYNRYLLYPDQPKNPNHTYSIHIDIYEKIAFTYHGSWNLSIPFPFLPVNRMATQIQIPLEKSEEELTNCSSECGNHGKCFKYINSNKTFCHCNEGYSGRFCNITYQHSCSSDSIALNSSICLCPLNKFGSKCYLQHTACRSNNNPCQNNGKCIPMNDRIKKNAFICLYNENYLGYDSENLPNKIDINFKIDSIPPVIFGHFITAFYHRQHQQRSIFEKILFGHNSISLFYKEPFNLLFIEISNNYYLTILREKFIPGEYISADVTMNNMCVNITKILNSTLLNYSYTRRLKYYPLQCRENLKFKCFYDEKHMCICDESRFANCFRFSYSNFYDCQGDNYCENDGKCIQDRVKCLTTSVCKCEDCYYGDKCQLTTKGYSISLDVIFGHHIKPWASFLKQSKAVKITASLTIIMFILGCLNGLICILTFRQKSLIEVGCGIYLLMNSITSLLTITLFTIKYCQLVTFQMNLITNRSFIDFNCKSTDVLLKIFLCFGDWLNACAAIERAFTTIQGTHFSKSKSTYIAKYVIPTILCLITISYIHDPISRQLFDDEDEKRTWCIVKYSTSLKTFDKFINLFHFLAPFIVNFLSALVIIIQVFRTRARVYQKTSNVTIYAQIKRHKHLLISPCILILLALPRLIILFTSRCMKSAQNPWLFLVGYYISFVPPLLIIPVFILPSTTYKKEFLGVIKKMRLYRQ
ncbi:unnamed protein product [Adineta steineri]|uniref:EGF-like domain-containing protein n=1 Tax=Adineta steineri TaxID=433720 RepID=A0A815HFS4_9BILA|nr:unnamed protein product [Adineta steineri]